MSIYLFWKARAMGIDISLKKLMGVGAKKVGRAKKASS